MDYRLLFNKKIKITFQDGNETRYYTGQLLEENNTYIVFKDKFEKTLILLKTQIIKMEEL